LVSKGRIDEEFHEYVPNSLTLTLELRGWLLSFGGLDLKWTIPTEIGLLSSLQSFMTQQNALLGTISREFFHLKNLTSLDVAINQLTGTIPSELGSMSRDTDTVRVSFNNLTGTIPSEVGVLTALTALDFQLNDLVGTIPTELGRLTDLLYLNLNDNYFTGTVPSDMTGSLDVICDDVENFFQLQSLWADCMMDPPEVECSCCDVCCGDSVAYCNNMNSSLL